ncbi:MAG: bifunctional phosphoglucose/phosphomannose isomerase [Fimbriimonadaceae bacterium]
MSKHPLDDQAFITELDPKGMYALTCDFPNQCRRALEIFQARPVHFKKPAQIILSGLGGSAAGGDFARCLCEAEGTIPFLVNRDYFLPGFVSPETLVVCSSYSGNTEETLSAYHDARAKGAQIIVLTSGGQLATLAQEHGYPAIIIPGGQPPRTALGFMLIPLVALLAQSGAINAQAFEAAFSTLDSCVQEWSAEVALENNPTKQLAEALVGKVANLYGLGGPAAAVANRWKGQINENAKNMAFANVFPELNHNEILGWVASKSQNVAWVVVNMQCGKPTAKILARAQVTAELIGKDATFFDVESKGDSLLSQMLSLVLFGDFVSIYLAALNRVDPENIDSINYLKSALANVS